MSSQWRPVEIMLFIINKILNFNGKYTNFKIVQNFRIASELKLLPDKNDTNIRHILYPLITLRCIKTIIFPLTLVDKL